jgi:hypothetical protein
MVDIPAINTIAGRYKRQYIHGPIRPMNTTLPSFAAGPSLLRSQRITVYPNLVSQKQFWLQFYYVDKCVFSVHLYTLTGVEVFRKFFHHGSYNGTHAVQVPRNLVTGIYRLAIRSEHIDHMQPIVIR